MVRGSVARLVGLVLMAGGLLGIVVSLLGIVLVWSAEGRINHQVAAVADSARQALDGADEMLGVTAQAVDQAEGQLATVERTLQGVATSLEGTAATTRAFGRLAGGDLAGVIRDTRAALQSAAVSAGVVDGTLRLVTGLPFLGSGRYEPKVPLAESIGRVEHTLDPVPAQLTQVDKELGQAADSIDTIRGSLSQVTGEMGGAAQSLQAARMSIQGYQDTVVELEGRITQLQADFTRGLRIFNVFATLALLWLLVAQVGLISQGYEWLRREDVP